MRLRLFEYVILLHPVEKKDGKEASKSLILQDIKRKLAKDEKEIGMLAAREIPEKHMDDLERIEIVVRPF